MTDDHDVIAVMRRGMGAEADRVPDGDALAVRILDAANAEAVPSEVMRQSRRRGWLLPSMAAAAVVAAVATGVAVSRLSDDDARTRAPSSGSQPTTRPDIKVGPAGAVLPTGFRPVDLSFVDGEDGWALGSVPCRADRCTEIARTRDGGRSWVSVPAPPLRLPDNVAIDPVLGGCNTIVCVSKIRFATPQVGYVFNGWQSFMTVDGGSTWRPQSIGEGLTIANGTAWAFQRGSEEACAAGCRWQLRSAPIGSTSWTTVDLPKGADVGTGAELVRRARVAVVEIYGSPTAGRSTLLISTDDGATWDVRGEPCPQDHGPTTGQAPLIAPDGSISLLCSAADGGSGQFTVTSSDAGATFRSSAPIIGGSGYVHGAASSTVSLVATDQLYRTADGGRTWQPVNLGGGPANARTFYIEFDDTTTGRLLVQGNDGVSPLIWTTTDSGVSWHSRTFS